MQQHHDIINNHFSQYLLFSRHCNWNKHTLLSINMNEIKMYKVNLTFKEHIGLCSIQRMHLEIWYLDIMCHACIDSWTLRLRHSVSVSLVRCMLEIVTLARCCYLSSVHFVHLLMFSNFTIIGNIRTSCHHLRSGSPHQCSDTQTYSPLLSAEGLISLTFGNFSV